MKVINIILLAMMFTACSVDDEAIVNEVIANNEGCECYTTKQVRTWLYYNNTLVSDSGFIQSTTSEYYGNDCDEDGDYVNGSTGQFPSQIIEIRYLVNCN